ncbi:MAG TPA: ATP-binding protein [Gaiellaceae bacterium]|nr:ATP-binding protein [Gaiellaceae bacterium]
MKLIRSISFVRVALVPLLLIKILLDRDDFPTGAYEQAAWTLLGIHAGLALLLLALSYRWRRRLRYLAGLNVLTDFALTSALMFVFAWEPGQPLRSLQLLVVLEAALFFRLVGGLIVGAATLPILLALDYWRHEEFGTTIRYDALVLRVVVALALGAVVGRLVDMERGQASDAEHRAAEAERLRDELGRRVDLLETTSRAARALGSSLDLDEAFAAFVRELRSLLPFDRAAILLAEGGGARVMATAGVGAEDYLEPGTAITVPGSILEAVITEGRTIYREDIAEQRYAEEAGLLALGVRARVLAPLQLGTRSIGALAVARTEPGSFREEEVGLVTLLGRLVATAVQNLRTYEAERATVDEVRRLSSLRADFVSMVSHELRSPMAAVIGSARTLQARWRELRPEQREAFLAVIADETTRLAALVGDVLDTSRIEAGTFGYRFDDVDLAEVLRDSVAAAEIGQDEVRLSAELPAALPTVRGDAERLRQLVDNLISNAIKYSDSGGEVIVDAGADDGHVVVHVRDTGPGIRPEHHEQIFEKFGRATGSAKPGTGLGLFLSRSFAEAHGGSLDVSSTSGEGAVFTLRLPVS